AYEASTAERAPDSHSGGLEFGTEASCIAMHTSTPVLLLQSIAYGGLAIARSLGRLGVPVYAVESKSLSPVFYSRYCHGHFCWNVETAAPEQTLGVLRNIALRIGGSPLLIPTTDNSAMFVAAHGEALKHWYRF